MAPTKPRAKHERLTHAQKSEIVEHAIKNPGIKQGALANWARHAFNLSSAPHRTTIGDILQNRAKFTTLQPQDRSLKRTRAVKSEVIDSSIKNWVFQMQYQNQPICDDLIKAKARSFAALLGVEGELKFSNGWLQKFKKRHGFHKVKIHGESGDAQMEGIEGRIEELRARIAVYGLDKSYNFDETGLFYNLAPDTTIAQRQIEGKYKHIN
jgi:hypothetical protein